MTHNTPSLPPLPKWQDETGGTVACTEKIKVMRENMQELFETAQEAFEDGLLMGCNEEQLRHYLVDLIRAVHNPYQK